LNTRPTRILLALVLAATSLNSAAETPEDKAFMVKFVELNKQSLRLAVKGDDDGLVQLNLSLKELAKTPHVSAPCLEAVRAKIALVDANVQYLRADDDKEGPYLQEIEKQGRIVNERRRTCLGGRMDP
jgi:hypothetical protein